MYVETPVTAEIYLRCYSKIYAAITQQKPLTFYCILYHYTPPFCRAKVWFLACKKGVFTLQKYGFCNAKVGILCMLLCHSELQVYVGALFFGVCRYVNTRKITTH